MGRTIDDSSEEADLTAELSADLEGYLRNHAQEVINELVRAEEASAAFKVSIDFLQLANCSPKATELLLCDAKSLLEELELAIIREQEIEVKRHNGDPSMSVKEFVRPRLVGLHALATAGITPSLGDLRAAHIGRLVIAYGSIVRTGAVKVLETVRYFECPKCGHQFFVPVDIAAGATIKPPTACPSKKIKPCKGKSFRHMTEMQHHTDVQELRIQEDRQNAAGGSARAIDVIVQDELVDMCQAGDKVLLAAVVSQRWRSCYPGARCDLELVLMANNITLLNARKASVEVTPESMARFSNFWENHRHRPWAGREKILECMCPQIHGMPFVKLATLIMLIGGVPRTDESGTSIRGQVHMLLVGDPGTGKSQLMKYAARLSPRSVITSGKASSAAGLTATAVKEDSHWALEAGAMVLADGGLCCIDEFDGLKEACRATIHEAMEQQTVSVAKAGLLTSLNTRTTVFGVCNPKGRYDSRVSLGVNTSLSGPLLSRFDIVLVLQDLKNPEWDKTVADHILFGTSHLGSSSADAMWDLEMIRQYISWVQKFRSVMTAEAEGILMRYYQMQRQSSSRDAARTTVRMFESLIRIAQAHARLMARAEVVREDSLVAIMLIDASMVESSLIQCNPMLDARAGRPEEEFKQSIERLSSILCL